MPTVIDEVVVAGAYDTSGNGGRKIVSSGNNIIMVVKNGATEIRIYKKSGNNSPVLLANFAVTTLTDVCIEDIGNGYVGILYSHSGTTVSFRTVKVSDGTLGTIVNVDSGQSSVGNVTMIANLSKTELNIGVSTKNTTYPNSFNIRYAKGMINGDGGVTWGTVEQVTIINTSGRDFQNPSINLDKLNVPVINFDVYGYQILNNTLAGVGGARSIFAIKKSNELPINVTIISSGWTAQGVHVETNYVQSSSSSIFIPQSANGLTNGLIGTAWHGKDATHTTTDYIRFSKSIDSGVTWSTMQKLVVGTNATLTANKSGKLFITYEDTGITKRIESTDNGDTWSSPITVGSGINPSSLFDLTINITEPLTIRKGTSSVLFSGSWSTTEISATPSHLGEISNKNNILSYSITTDGEMSTITEKVNGETVGTKTATSGESLIVGLTQEQWDLIRFGKYKDVTGGLNTLTVEMGSDKWTYTFDKRLATDSEISESVKAVQDSNEVYLPVIKQKLVDKVGGSVEDSYENIISEIQLGKKTSEGTLLSSSATKSFLGYGGASTSFAYVSLDMSMLDFIPTLITFSMEDKTGVYETTWFKDNFYSTGGNFANVSYSSNAYRVPYINGVMDIPIQNANKSYRWKAYE